jgi:predicted nucleic acid-binding protein
VRIFHDTNILLDVIEERAPFFKKSQLVLDSCDARGFEILISPHGLATTFYITERKSGGANALAIIHQILGFASVATLGDHEARNALGYGIADYEDALQAASAVAGNADWLVTRDATGFAGSPVPVLSPEEFLRRFPV